MPVSGGDGREGAPDGVSAPPDTGRAADIQGRTDGGESGGGAYPNPQTGKEGSSSAGFMGHGGQTEIGYHGGGQLGQGDAPNSATGSDSDEGTERGGARWPAGEHGAHAVHAQGQSFTVIETNGNAEAETMGKVGTDAAYEREQEQPGSG